MSQNAAPVLENEKPSNAASRSKLLHKAEKKSKKRSRQETDDPNVPRPRSKKHKRQYVDPCQDSHQQPICTNSSCDVDLTSSEKVSEPKRKKRIKSDARHDGAGKESEAPIRNKQVGSKNKHANQPQGRIEPKTVTEVDPFSASDKPGFHISSGFDARESTMIPISPELQPISSYHSPDPAASPPLSTRSHHSSDTSHSSYSRSSLQHSSTRRHHHEPEPNRSFRHRRMEDLRPRFSHRAYAGYRRISRDRDSSPEEWSAEDFGSHHRRGRSRGSPRSGHDHVSHSYGYRHSDSRQRYDSSPRSSGHKRYASRRSHSRSASGKRDRRYYEASDRPHPRTRHYPRKLSPVEYSRHKTVDRHRTSHESVCEEPSKHRSSRGEPTHPSETKHSVGEDDRNHSYKPLTKHAGLPAMEERHRHSVERPRSKSPAKDSKYDRPKSRSRSGPDRGRPVPRRSPLRTSDSKHRKSPGSHSPRAISTDKTRKPKISAKVAAVVELLGELTAEAVSDDELGSILPPDILSGDILDSTAVRNNMNPSGEMKPGLSNSQRVDTCKQTVSAPEPEAEHVSATDALENLCSRIRQKLNEPEPWDSTELSSADGDDGDVDQQPEESPVVEHSLVNMATTNRSHPSFSQQVLANLSTQWRELIESTEKNLTSVGTETDFVSPAVHVADILRPIQSDLKLLPIQKRSKGATILQHIGVSRRYLGPDLLACLNNELQCILTDGDANDEDSDATASESRTPLLPITDIAWMQRSRTNCTSDPSYLNSLLPFGSILSANSDLFIRQHLLGAVG